MGFVSQNIEEVSNSHIWEFLRYYLALHPSPKYAVFIDGLWGSGKTHLVQKIVDDHYRGWKDDYVRVSLFGLGNTDDLDNAVFSAVYPTLTSPGSHVIGGVVKAGLNFLRTSTDLRLQKILNKKRAGLYIFDDLERCEIELGKVLGYINSFVEHGAKVIIIGDQSRLKVTQKEEDLERYNIEREKVVGKTLKVAPSYQDAWNGFVGALHSKDAKDFLLKRGNLIKSIFEESNTSNLRLLQLATFDFERIFLVLTPTQLENSDAMNELVKLFFAVSFEVRRGRLLECDVSSREGLLTFAIRRYLSEGKGKDEPPSPLELAKAQYKTVDITSQILSSEILVDLLFNGVVDERQIHRALSISRYFVTEAETPAWVKLIYVLDLTDQEFESAVVEVEEKFKRKDYLIIGEFLHVFSHRLWLAKNGLMVDSAAVVVQQCVEYLDFLYKSGSLEIPDAERSRIFSSYDGYTYGEVRDPEFGKILDHLKALLAQVKVDQYPRLAQVLLDEMDQDVELFHRRICLTNSSDNTLWEVPVLAEMDADDFMARFLRQTPAHQQVVMNALRQRYEIRPAGADVFAQEEEWLKLVKNKLLLKAETLSRLSRQRIRLLVESNINPVLNR